MKYNITVQEFCIHGLPPMLSISPRAGDSEETSHKYEAEVYVTLHKIMRYFKKDQPNVHVHQEFVNHGVLDWIDDMSSSTPSAPFQMARSGLLFELVTTVPSLYGFKPQDPQFSVLLYLSASKTLKDTLSIPELSYHWLTITKTEREEKHRTRGDRLEEWEGHRRVREVLAFNRFILEEVKRVWDDPEYSNPVRWEDGSELATFRQKVLQAQCDVEDWKVEEWPLEVTTWDRKRTHVHEILEILNTPEYVDSMDFLGDDIRAYETDAAESGESW